MKYKAAIASKAAIAFLVASGAHAETWQAIAELVTVSQSCVPNSAQFYLSVDESRFSLTRPDGKSFDSAVDPDGSVKVVYQSPVRAIGVVTIVGNARSKTLELTASGYPGCTYSLKEHDAPNRAVAVRPWRVTMKLLSGSSFCAGGMAEVRESGRTFSLHVLNNSSLVLWSITMAADGSAQGEVRGPSVGGTGSSRVKVNVPAGSGPREFEYVNLTYGCRNLVQPM